MNMNNDNSWQNIDITSEIKPKLTGNARIVLERRYLAKNDEGEVIETPAQLFRRVARYIASADMQYGLSKEDVSKTADAFYEMMARMEFIPNSPTLMNAGRPLGQLAACFVLPVEDSMDKIFDSVKNMALIHKSGGGTGFSFSRLRPRDDMVKSTAGVSSGPVSFMNIFNAATETIKQGGTRRGANMAILSIDHPNIIEFIKAKEDLSALTNFNISVALTDEFMEAVRDDTDYPLRNPRTGSIVGHIKARETFDLIVEKAWNTGEPGIVFIDRINAHNPLKKVGLIESTNPCVTADTWVQTAEGPRMVSDLLGKSFTAIVDDKKYSSTEKGFFSTGKKKILRLITSEGYQVRLTGNHPVLRAVSISRTAITAEWTEAGELNPGDTIMLNNHRQARTWDGPGSTEEGYLTGLLLGDGTLEKDKAIISVWPREKAANGFSREDDIMTEAYRAARTLPHRNDFQGFMEVKGRGEYRMAPGALKSLASSLGMSPGNKIITPEIEKCSSNFYRGFLRGLFDADASIQGTQRKGISIRLAQSDSNTLEAVQRMLARLGIHSNIYMNRRPAGEKLLPDGKGGMKYYHTMAQHELIISKDNMSQFSEIIDFTDSEKSEKLRNLIRSYNRSMNRERFTAEVKEIIPDGSEKVYDVQIPGINAFDGNGIMLHNCGEQPLLPYASCNLGSINLNSVVTEKKGKAEIDYDKLREITATAVHFLDNVIDVNRYPLTEIEEMTKANRKIGLGIMGFADLLIKLKVPYNSDEAVDLAEKIMATIQDKSREVSRELAKTRGAFPNFKKSDYAERGEPALRNATTTTIAPTGTISIIAGSSSGIEPIFALAYVRNVMDNDMLIETNPIFEKQAKNLDFFNEDVMEKVAEHGSAAGIDEIPGDIQKIFVTAHDVSPKWHIRLQAAFQKYVDNAVSKTVNFPRGATRDDIEEVYRLAYELDCKGVTVYRDGSREGQVLSTKSTEKKDEPAQTPPHPTPSLPGHIVPRARKDVTWGATRKMTTGCGALYVTINEDEEGMFEVFATMGKSGGCAASQTEAVSRLISLALRSGIEKEQIIKQIKGVRCPNQAWEAGGRIYSCSDAIAKAIERHISGGQPKTDTTDTNHDLQKNIAETNGKSSDEVIMMGVCPDCHAPLEYESGCSVCRSCGYSRCG